MKLLIQSIQVFFFFFLKCDFVEFPVFHRNIKIVSIWGFFQWGKCIPFHPLGKMYSFPSFEMS